jgi:hypothetical protein
MWPVVTNIDTVIKNYTSRNVDGWNVTLTVIDDQDVVGSFTGRVVVLAHDLWIFRIATNTSRAKYPPMNYTDIDSIVQINVSVMNTGHFTETFDVSTRWSIFLLGELQEQIIDTQPDVTLLPGANTTLTFNWNTTGFNVTHPDAYTLIANASTVQYEYRKGNNEFVGEAIRIRHHDIAITDIKLNGTSMSPQDTLTINPGDLLLIDVTVLNQGDFNETNIAVTAYYDNDPIETQTIHQINNKSYSDREYVDRGLPENHTITLTFTWNTNNVTEATYQIRAEMTTVPDEYDTSDNVFYDGYVTIGVPPFEFPLGGAAEIALTVLILYIIWKRKLCPKGLKGKPKTLKYDGSQ